MTKQLILICSLLIVSITSLSAQQMDYEKNLEILSADYGKCYTIGDYMLCPEKKLIIDTFGYFPDSTLQYDKETMVIFAGFAFLDDRSMNIDWGTVRLLSYRYDKSQFTDGKNLYEIDGSGVLRISKYDKSTYISYTEEPAVKSTDKKELNYYFYVKDNMFYYDEMEIFEPFDIPNLQIITSRSGHEANYVTDGKQVIFCGPTGAYASIEKNGKEYVTVKDLIIDGVDLQTLRVLGEFAGR